MTQSYTKTTLTLMTAILLSPLSKASDAKEPENILTCKKLQSSLLSKASGIVRPFCNQAEIDCKALKFLQERPKGDNFRRQIEGELKRETRYRLDICEVALRKISPNALPER